MFFVMRRRKLLQLLDTCKVLFQVVEGASDSFYVKQKWHHCTPTLFRDLHCSALLTIEIAETISNQLGLALQDFRFYSDRKVVLGYIYNTARQFPTYVANRVARILSSTSSRQWSYVMMDNNPADQGTKSLRPSEMQDSTWLIGPTSLVSEVSETSETYELHIPRFRQRDSTHHDYQN